LDADTLDGSDSAAFQLSVMESCTGQVMVGINADGTVSCETDDIGIDVETDPTVLASVKDGVDWVEVSNIPAGFADGIDNTGGDGDITGVTASTGLSGGGSSGIVTLSADTSYLQQRVSTTCTAGSSIRAISGTGTVTCETDDVGEDSAGIEFRSIGLCGNIPASMRNCGSITVSTPQSGYLLVQLSGYAITSGGSTVVQVGIGDTATTFDHYSEAGILSGLDTIRRSFPLHSSFVYPVSEGNKTIFVIAKRIGFFSVDLENLYVSAIFVPNRY